MNQSEPSEKPESGQEMIQKEETNMMHMNTYGLMMNGFRMVAAYEAFTKGERKLNVECYTNGTEYLVRSFHSGKTAWDSIFTDKDEANQKVNQLLNLKKWHKRIV